MEEGLGGDCPGAHAGGGGCLGRGWGGALGGMCWCSCRWGEWGLFWEGGGTVLVLMQVRGGMGDILGGGGTVLVLMQVRGGMGDI